MCFSFIALCARMAAKRAEEEKNMDEATLARIRAKRAAKEAKKQKKEKPSKKSICYGIGVNEFLVDLQSRSLYVFELFP